MNTKKLKFIVNAAAVLMLILGLVRGAGCAALFGGAASAEIANVAHVKVLIAGICLAIVSILLIVSSVLLLRRNRFALKLSFASIALFLIFGLTNSFLLFGKPFLADQIVWLTAAAVVVVLLMLIANAAKK
jgi:hypothetical protein